MDFEETEVTIIARVPTLLIMPIFVASVACSGTGGPPTVVELDAGAPSALSAVGDDACSDDAGCERATGCAANECEGRD